MKYLVSVILCILVLFTSAVQAKSAKKVLILTSNLVDMGDPEKHDARNNLWEVAPPYHVFLNHGFEVDFVSPKGGKVEFQMFAMGISKYTIKYEGFLDKTNNTLKPLDINANDYWGVYIGGGYGPLFDVANDKNIQSIIAKIYEAGGFVGSAGHGAGAFADVMLSSGEYMVKGKKVAGFPNSTEVTKPWAKQGTLLPIMVEDKLNKNGAIAQNKKTLDDKTQVVIDERIVSTLFLDSAAIVAKEMIIAHQK
ncbi:type 1 glutamine amidotransferase domain-containing protein [Pseudoalteromonas luteoviolacea]|uniref:DJ-1/PfpI domain-containing protein n=1 Tax=Pseudoalteromonas luteoviolacea S4060-1 TaxID=1365257 RepID=A0A167JKK3_9GAMM|nr:type 1 glutamine amidotransferase domain-containing protein [Pseudoalteromonas luteoviolacea]KZN61253.1 hypothetical protein N478_04110 [Pseudoalteromonas luteoviolacea S4060-1]